jgi:hypothetical protein
MRDNTCKRDDEGLDDAIVVRHMEDATFFASLRGDLSEVNWNGVEGVEPVLAVGEGVLAREDTERQSIQSINNG